MRLLLVEDDVNLAAQLEDDLRRAGFAVDRAADGELAAFQGDTESYDAVVLDLGLPDRPGLKVLQDWREAGNDVPVLVLTARSAWHEKVDGFKSGADDYLGKPFHVEELVERLRALIRRRHGRPQSQLSVGALSLDAERQCVRLPDGRELELSGTEFRLLQYFMHHPGRVLSKSRLLEHVYGVEPESDGNVIEVYVNRLRRKLGPALIQTRRGQGYVLQPDPCDH
jgi:DNA-binding response OmpR family regulator